MPDIHFHFHVSDDTQALEQRMSELESNFGEIRDLVANETVQSAEQKAKLTALTKQFDELTKLINEGMFPKERVLTFFEELKAAIPGIVPDEIPPVEEPVEPPAE